MTKLKTDFFKKYCQNFKQTISVQVETKTDQFKSAQQASCVFIIETKSYNEKKNSKYGENITLHKKFVKATVLKPFYLLYITNHLKL